MADEHILYVNVNIQSISLQSCPPSLAWKTQFDKKEWSKVWAEARQRFGHDGFIDSFVATGPSVKFTLRMSHVGRELELFVWCLRLLPWTWTPASFTVDSNNPGRAELESCSQLSEEGLKPCEKCCVDEELHHHICVWLHSEPEQMPVFTFLPLSIRGHAVPFIFSVFIPAVYKIGTLQFVGCVIRHFLFCFYQQLVS